MYVYAFCCTNYYKNVLIVIQDSNVSNIQSINIDQKGNVDLQWNNLFIGFPKMRTEIYRNLNVCASHFKLH